MENAKTKAARLNMFALPDQCGEPLKEYAIRKLKELGNPCSAKALKELDLQLFLLCKQQFESPAQALKEAGMFQYTAGRRSRPVLAPDLDKVRASEQRRATRQDSATLRSKTIEDLQKLATPLSTKELKKQHPGLHKRCKTYFESAKKAMQLASVYKEIPVHCAKPEVVKAAQWPPGQILEALQKFSTIPNELTLEAFTEATKVRKGRVNRLFGSWEKALLAAGRQDAIPAKAKPEGRTTESLTAEISRVAAELGGVPSANAFKEYSDVPVSAVVAKLGSWTKALKAAGLTPLPTVFGSKTSQEREARKRNKAATKARQKQRMLDLGWGAVYEGSQSQFLVTRLVAEVLQEQGIQGMFVSEQTFEWLRNPASGSKMRLDAYFPACRLAVEYQSQFHFKNEVGADVNHDLEETVFRDYVKRQLLRKHGVRLLEISFFEPQTQEAIREKLQGLDLFPRQLSA